MLSNQNIRLDRLQIVSINFTDNISHNLVCLLLTPPRLPSQFSHSRRSIHPSKSILSVVVVDPRTCYSIHPPSIWILAPATRFLPSPSIHHSWLARYSSLLQLRC
ncbi:hypothetical protein L2E82_47175 [Cichorium intybus]|uniref:Uncharacterized protein n=1 Tax=Cichorium intybus TaxID=13427 RepID=A0ACB8YUM3_CICIN|nr:hypothetical protein L2E82_47175 [Cichorium intybus]